MPSAATPAGTVACTNLRQLSDRSGLVAVGQPCRVAPPDYVPLSVNQRPDGSYRLLVISGGTTIGSVDPDVYGSYSDVLELPSRMDHIVPSRGVLILATADGDEYSFRYDSAADRWLVDGPMPELPPVVIRADDHAELSETLEPFTLAGTYTHCTEPVIKADKAAITARLSAAAEALTAKASVAGRCIDPLLMSYRLLDEEGHCIHTSVPVWVGPQEGGFALCSMIGAAVDRQDGGRCAVAAMTVAATAFRPVVVVPRQLPQAWARKVAAMEILVSPQLTAYRPGMQAGCRLRAVDQSSGRLEAYIPGASNGMVPTPENRVAMVAGMLDRFADTATVLAVVPYPFGGGFGCAEGETVALSLPVSTTAAGAASVIDKALARSVTALAPGSEAALIAASAPPHTFSAGTTLHAADMVAYGNIVVRRGRPPHAAVLAGAAVEKVGTADAACHYVAVTFADGSSDCAVTADLDAAVVPVSIGPVVVYPDADAARITVAARGAAGAVTRRSLPLSRSCSGRFACYIDPELRPVPLVADGAPLAVPADIRQPRARPGVVAVARSADPRRLLVAATASADTVQRIVPAVRSASSWDFGRQHLLVFASDGICSMSVDARRTSVAVNKLWPIGVVRPDAVTSAPDGIYAALDGGTLVRMTGSRIYQVEGVTDAVAVAWCGQRGELWIMSAAGAVRVLDPDLRSVYDRTFGPVLSLHDCDGRPYALTADGLFDINREIGGDLPVEWAVRMPVPYRRRPVAMAVDLQSAGLDATLSLRADGGAGSGASLPVTMLRMRGAVNAPVCLRLAAPHRRYLTLGISGTVAPGTTVSHYELTLNSSRS